MSPFVFMTARGKKSMNGDANLCAVACVHSSLLGTCATSYAGLFGAVYMMPVIPNKRRLKRKRQHHAHGILYLYRH